MKIQTNYDVRHWLGIQARIKQKMLPSIFYIAPLYIAVRNKIRLIAFCAVPPLYAWCHTPLQQNCISVDWYFHVSDVQVIVRAWTFLFCQTILFSQSPALCTSKKSIGLFCQCYPGEFRIIRKWMHYPRYCISSLQNVSLLPIQALYDPFRKTDGIEFNS